MQGEFFVYESLYCVGRVLSLVRLCSVQEETVTLCKQCRKSYLYSDNMDNAEEGLKGQSHKIFVPAIFINQLLLVPLKMS